MINFPTFDWRSSLSDIINQEKIEANLNDGVLKLTLPKAAKAQPRKIEIKC